MTDFTLASHHEPAVNYHKLTLYLIGFLLVIRLACLLLSPWGLHGDEAQYWAWSKNLDWGYFTKPPLIAWIIWSTTNLFGEAEWAVRLSSPLLHSITTYVIFRTALSLFNPKTGFWAASLYLLMPALWLSSGIVSTDVPLLLCWALALNAWVHIRNKMSWARAVQLGIAVGMGILAKYAMLFFLPALGLAFLFDAQSRQGLNTIKGYAAGILTFLIILPNILWNINNDFATLTHTAANANLGADVPFHPAELARFLGDQFVVFGPISFLLLTIACVAALKGHLKTPAFWLTLFVLSPLFIISIQALLSRANANWAVTAYVSGSILTAHFGVVFWSKARPWLIGGTMMQSIICGILVVLLLVPSWLDAAGLSNAVKRLRQWPETVKQIENVYTKGYKGQAFTDIAFDKRIIFYDSLYYGLSNTAPIKMWMYRRHPENQAELQYPLAPQKGPVLVVNYYSDYEDELRTDFTRLDRLPDIDIALGGGKRRVLRLWAAYGYRPTQTR